MQSLQFQFTAVITIIGLTCLIRVHSKTYQTYNGYGKGFNDYMKHEYPNFSERRRGNEQSNNILQMEKKMRLSPKRDYDTEPLIFEDIAFDPIPQMTRYPYLDMRGPSKNDQDSVYNRHPRTKYPRKVPRNNYRRPSYRKNTRHETGEFMSYPSDRNRKRTSEIQSSKWTKPQFSKSPYENKEITVSIDLPFPPPYNQRDYLKMKHYARRFSPVEGKSGPQVSLPTGRSRNEKFDFDRLKSPTDQWGKIYDIERLTSSPPQRENKLGFGKLQPVPSQRGKPFSINRAGYERGKTYDACRKLPDHHYNLDGRFRKLFYRADPQCFFVKCANRKAYLNPCSIASRNEKDGTGFCSRIDLEGHCGISYHDAHEKLKRA